MTGVGRKEVYRNRWISTQAMTLKGGVHHKVRLNVTDENGFWSGPFGKKGPEWEKRARVN